MGGKVKIYLFGRHRKRIPFSYAAYRPFFTPFFEFVDEPSQADFLVCGFFVDIREDAEILAHSVWRKTTPLVVFSEEPLWDTLWYYRWQRSVHDVVVSVSGQEERWPFQFINHANSDLYNFERIPYFLTTEDHYLLRYSQFLSLELQKSPQQLHASWQAATKKYRFVAEKRLEPKYHKANEDGSLLALSVYRTELALQFSELTTAECTGKGWQPNVIRQALPDWHLDKLVQLQKDRFIVSALENTTLPNYISEKLFDALAVGAVPIYWASAGHRVTELVPQNLLLNVANLDINAASNLISAFEPDLPYAELYQQSQRQLLTRFSSLSNLIDERRLFAAKAFAHFKKLANQ